MTGREKVVNEAVQRAVAMVETDVSVRANTVRLYRAGFDDRTIRRALIEVAQNEADVALEWAAAEGGERT